MFKKDKKRTKAWKSNEALLITKEKRRVMAWRDSSPRDKEAYKAICKKVKRAVTKEKHLYMANTPVVTYI